MNTLNKSKINIQYDTKTQKYFCRVMFKGNHKFFSSNHSSRKKAEQEIFAKIDEWLETNSNEPKEKNFKELWTLYLKEKALFIRPTSLNSIKYKYSHFKPLAHLPISSIQKKIIKKLYTMPIKYTG